MRKTIMLIISAAVLIHVSVLLIILGFLIPLLGQPDTSVAIRFVGFMIDVAALLAIGSGTALIIVLLKR